MLGCPLPAAEQSAGAQHFMHNLGWCDGMLGAKLADNSGVAGGHANQ
jgi:hypothetical protein